MVSPLVKNSARCGTQQLLGAERSAPSSAPASVFFATDPEIFWLNNRPFWMHGLLGTGGFATVFKAEMLVPFGFKVARDALGGLIFDDEGCVAVHRSEESTNFCSRAVLSDEDCSAAEVRGPAETTTMSSSSGVSLSVEHHERDSESGAGRGSSGGSSELHQALELSEPPPKSMSFFQLAGEDCSDGGSSVPGLHTPCSEQDGRRRTPSAKFFFASDSDVSHQHPDDLVDAERRGAESETLLSVLVQNVDTRTGRGEVFPPAPVLAPPEFEKKLGPNRQQGLLEQEYHTGVDHDTPAGRDERAGALDVGARGSIGADPFAVTPDDRIFGSGAFFAVKVQAAKTKKQLEDFAKEVDNFRKLRGSANIVQIRDHTLMWRTLHLVILMELGACDLQTLLKRFRYSLAVKNISRIWCALLKAVVAAHQQDIIHRDLKPQNFLLVPITSPFADRILATTPTQPEKFEFRFIEDEHDQCGDLEVAVKDPCTGEEVGLRLVIKLSDFGLAQQLEMSHLSVQGHAGTLKYMAPETVQPTTDGRRKLSKSVDIWALGMILFQMLHAGRTPYDRFFRKGDIEAAVAIASEVVYTDVMRLERAKVWAAERQKLDQRFEAENSASKEKTCLLLSASMVRLWLRIEVFFRICERCLAFEASDRAEAVALRRWVQHGFDWWSAPPGTMCANSDEDEISRLAREGVEMVHREHESNDQQELSDTEVALIGDRIGKLLFPKLWQEKEFLVPVLRGGTLAPIEQKHVEDIDLERGGKALYNSRNFARRAGGAKTGVLSESRLQRNTVVTIIGLGVMAFLCVLVAVVSVLVVVGSSRGHQVALPAPDEADHQPTLLAPTASAEDDLGDPVPAETQAKPPSSSVSSPHDTDAPGGRGHGPPPPPTATIFVPAPSSTVPPPGVADSDRTPRTGTTGGRSTPDDVAGPRQGRGSSATLPDENYISIATQTDEIPENQHSPPALSIMRGGARPLADRILDLADAHQNKPAAYTTAAAPRTPTFPFRSPSHDRSHLFPGDIQEDHDAGALDPPIIADHVVPQGSCSGSATTSKLAGRAPSIGSGAAADHSDSGEDPTPWARSSSVMGPLRKQSKKFGRGFGRAADSESELVHGDGGVFYNSAGELQRGPSIDARLAGLQKRFLMQWRQDRTIDRKRLKIDLIVTEEMVDHRDEKDEKLGDVTFVVRNLSLPELRTFFFQYDWFDAERGVEELTPTWDYEEGAPGQRRMGMRNRKQLLKKQLHDDSHSTTVPPSSTCGSTVCSPSPVRSPAASPTARWESGYCCGPGTISSQSSLQEEFVHTKVVVGPTTTFVWTNSSSSIMLLEVRR